ncbi:hypothetical protein ACJJV6_03465 [Arthrobacter nitrophenolicus]|jgi:hypothetical protein|uniref:Uncharacterized protein n=1 Tax=Arthrobacter nitrophenolicus TaxID=683150 RepID=A0ACC6TDP6_9MICC
MEFTRRPVTPVYAGQEVALRFELRDSEPAGQFEFQIINTRGGQPIPIDGGKGGVVARNLSSGEEFERMVSIPEPGEYQVQFRAVHRVEAGKKAEAGKDNWEVLDTFTARRKEAPPIVRVALEPNARPGSEHAHLWNFIQNVTRNLRFERFAGFARHRAGRLTEFPGYGSLSYERLHELATEFVTESSLGNSFSPPDWDPEKGRDAAINGSYVSEERKDQADPFPPDFPEGQDYPLRLVPFAELIYVYWLEEGMLFQSLNRVLARFQNRRVVTGGDPLSRLAVSPLLPLRGILWGLAEAEKDRLSLRRRAAEYEYQYGLQLIGRAIPPAQMLVERRTQFLSAFHSLLHDCHHFYKEHNDKTVDADAFPLLSSLRELHLVLATGANNQYADMSVTARIETMEVQWMLAQPEMREFLGGRTMVPYDEDWMDRVDAMKQLQGWSDASITHFYDLAVHGEQLLLSVRHGRWNESDMDGDDAENWAIKWKPSIQRYVHAYRAVTGVDLSERVDTTMPSTLLQRRLARKLVRY